jgi:hypothetical protein
MEKNIHFYCLSGEVSSLRFHYPTFVSSNLAFPFVYQHRLSKKNWDVGRRLLTARCSRPARLGWGRVGHPVTPVGRNSQCLCRWSVTHRANGAWIIVQLVITSYKLHMSKRRCHNTYWHGHLPYVRGASRK